MNAAGSILTESISPLAWFALVKKQRFYLNILVINCNKSKKKN